MKKLLPAFSERILADSLDPRPLKYRKADLKDLKVIESATNLPAGYFHELDRPVNQRAFLACVAKLYSNAHREHLIVGLGERAGQTTRVSRLSHVVGDRQSVSVPTWMENDLLAHARNSIPAEVVMIHNHPRTFAENILDFDDGPHSSLSDRVMLFTYLTHPTFALKALADKGAIRCFVAKNGLVQEFRLPKIFSLFGLLTKLADSSPNAGNDIGLA